MTHERYIDPNSGAAPQPGGYAGPQAGLKGHAIGNVQEAVEASPEEQAPLDKLPESAVTEEVKELTKEQTEGTEQEQSEGQPEQESEEESEQESEEGNSEAEGESQGEPEEEAASYDPSEYSVPEVLAYVEENPDQRDAVLAAEKAGKDRKGVSEALSD